MTAAQVNESARQNLRLLRIGSATDAMVTSPSRDTYLRGAQEYSDSDALSYTQSCGIVLPSLVIHKYRYADVKRVHLRQSSRPCGSFPMPSIAHQ